MITADKIKQVLVDKNLEGVCGIESDLEFILWGFSEMDELYKNYEVDLFQD